MKAFRITLIIVLISALCVPGWTAPAGSDIAVVVNRNVPIDNLSFSELRKILLGDRQYWSSELRVTLLIRAPMARERDVVLSVLEMTEAQYRQYWIGKVFRAETSIGPKSISSNEMAFSLLNSIPGSIAFVDASQVPKDLKVVKLGGLLPGAKGYPLN